MFGAVEATGHERAEVRIGDELVSPADVVMDRAFTVPGSCAEVWPWLAQLGKWRAGWYFPRSVERFIPARRRAIRTIDSRWQSPAVGDVIPDYGGRHETFTVAHVGEPEVLVYTSQRRAMHLTWSIILRPLPEAATGSSGPQTRVLLRLRLAPVKRVWLATTAGEVVDLLTVAGMAAGLRERLVDAARAAE